MDKTDNNEDFPQFKKELTENLTLIAKTIEHIILTIEENDISILNHIEITSKELTELESKASTFFLNSLLSEYTNFMEEISHAVHKLSVKGHPAIIVIEKNDPVSPHITQGTAIHARISSQLLESIFNPESQIHRGAVLIQSNSIISASNVLPITEKVFWDRMYDVSEMAAVGLSERCDALILAVSNNGSTSFCMGGNLYPFTAT